MSQPDFLVNFQNSMNQLSEMNKTIAAVVQSKNAFNANLKTRLQQINELIQKLSGDINNLKKKTDDLQNQVNSNSAAVGDKDTQIAELKERINSLEVEKANLTKQLADFQNQVNAEKSAMQQKIDADEEQIRTLTDENTNIKNQANALTAELSSKGELQGQHAEQIKMQAEDFQKQLDQQKQANAAEIERLMAQIKQQEDQLTELQKQLQAKIDETTNQVKNIDDVNAKCKSDMENLNKEIASLKEENEGLVQRIIAATTAIVEATENLRMLSDAPPNTQSEQEVEGLFREIQNSIQAISNAIQGNAPSSSSREVKIQVPDADGNVRNIRVEDAIGKLKQKLSTETGDLSREPKIREAIDYINSNKTNNADNKILKYLADKQLGFTIGNNNVTLRGGRKRTKKNRKQKGGFTYKKMKRRSITSNSNSNSNIRRNTQSNSTRRNTHSTNGKTKRKL